MSAAEQYYRNAMLRELVLVDSALLEAQRLRATGDLTLAADCLLRAAHRMLDASSQQAGMVRVRLLEEGEPCAS